ncbi:MAG: porin family protein [Bacteroidales bacterium]|nr:porin family protein [Bacteroidales bacterium]MDE6237918.1 PorT family protein [Muribaculaceae bacterium]
MKKLKFTLIMALVAIFGCAQANAFFKFGVKAGLNVDKFHFSKSQLGKDLGSSNRCGVTAGVMTEFTVPVVGVGMDLSLMYTRMNGEVLNDGGEMEKIGKDFLEIPLNLKYKFNFIAVSRFVAPYIYTGPTLALKLGKGDNNFLTTKTAQWGWNLGIGVELIRHLQIGAGYTFGINNVVKLADKVVDIPGFNGVAKDVKIKNNYWTVTAAWLF